MTLRRSAERRRESMSLPTIFTVQHIIGADRKRCCVAWNFKVAVANGALPVVTRVTPPTCLN
jgi:hypothetical protein